MTKVPLVLSTFLEEKDTLHALAQFVSGATMLSMGEHCLHFEETFASFQGRRYAVLFNSGASANLALLQALKNKGNLQNNDKVGFSAVTWSTNPMPIIQLGMEPIAIDCDRFTLNTSSNNLRKCLDETSLTALFITNALGFCSDLDRIASICKEMNIILLEDNCESLGSELGGMKLGNFGLASTFSFYVSHHISTIEGGMVCTDDEGLAMILKLVRANGWDRNLSERERWNLRTLFEINSDLDAKYTFYDLGFNLRPTEITGFLGLRQLGHLPASVLRRQTNFYRMASAIASNKDFLPIQSRHLSTCSAFAIPVLCREKTLRQHYCDRFERAGVEIRPLIAGNIQKQPFYKKYVKSLCELPEADFIHDCGFYCGNHPDYSEEQLSIIENCLKPLELKP